VLSSLGKTPLVTIRFGPIEQLPTAAFRFAITVERAAVGRARRAGKERVIIRSREEKGGGGEDRLSSSSCEHGRKGSHAL
jgi:hypothetical protein